MAQRRYFPLGRFYCVFTIPATPATGPPLRILGIVPFQVIKYRNSFERSVGPVSLPISALVNTSMTLRDNKLKASKGFFISRK